jgi:hypothetical protein
MRGWVNGKKERARKNGECRGHLARTPSVKGRLHGLCSWRGRRESQNKSKDVESKARGKKVQIGNTTQVSIDLVNTVRARGRLHGLGSWRGRRKPQKTEGPKVAALRGVSYGRTSNALRPVECSVKLSSHLNHET